MIVGQSLSNSEDTLNSVFDFLQIELGISQNELAQKLGVTRSTIYRWKTGKRKIYLTTEQVVLLEEMLETCGLNFSDLPKDWSDEFPPRQ